MAKTDSGEKNKAGLSLGTNVFTDKKNLNSLYYKKTDKLQQRLDAWDRFGTNRIKFADWVIGKLPILHGTKAILDAGCGTGKLLTLLEKKYPKSGVYGIDISPAMVRISRSLISKKNKQNINIGDVMKLPFSENYFDVIVCTHVLYHVPNIPKAIREMKRVLKPGGTLLVTTTDYDLEQGLNKIHYRALRKLNFPVFMLRKKDYLRFTPRHALRSLGFFSSKITTHKFNNDLIYTEVSPCLDYYKSAMIYRNSRGVDDKRISSEMWSRLMTEVKNQITEEIDKHQRLIVKGRVFGFKTRKI